MRNISKRAERNQNEYLVKSFVDIENTFSTLALNENQLVYGRRGTGKTHLLKYFGSDLARRGIFSVELDVRLLGSTCGIYAESNIPIIERASRLFCDILCEIHDSLLNLINDTSCKQDIDLSCLVPLLDDFIELATKIVIDGNTQLETSSSQSASQSDSLKTALNFPTPKLNFDSNSTSSSTNTSLDKKVTSGIERTKVHISSITKLLIKIVKQLPKQQLWILIDEWSEIPLDLQPYVADMIKRTLFAIPSINVKIAAIEHRSRFLTRDNNVAIGLEVSSDASSSINLDEFMVFDNDKAKAIEFFGSLIYKHCVAQDSSIKIEKNLFLRDLFASTTAFEEFVRASEGIPRDALHIASNAALHSKNCKLKVLSIRESARSWFQTNKSKDINSNQEAIKMLDWIINKVIGQRQSRGFLIKMDSKNEVLDFLYDSRILHLVKFGVSAKSHKGKRFNLYALDYGCYADLLTTKDEPKGLIKDDNEYIDIPKIDFRSVKDSILDLNEFYHKNTLPLFEKTDELYLQAKDLGKLVIEPDNSGLEVLKDLPDNIIDLKVKDTVYIPVIFIGLVIRTKQGSKESTGAEIALAYNDYIAGEKKKKPNNISRALRENKAVLDEPWLVIHQKSIGNTFSLSDEWEKFWGLYFLSTGAFDFSI